MHWKPLLLAAPAALVLIGCQDMPPTPDLPDFDAEWDYKDPETTEARFREIAATEAGAGIAYRTELATQIARTHSLRSEFEQAHATLDAIQGDLDEAGAVARTRYLLERGRTFNSAGEKGRATELFLEAWEVGRDAGSERHAADALHMLGISTPPEEALAWNAKAMEYCEQAADEKARRWLGPLYNNTWYSNLELGHLELALEYAEKSRAFRESIQDEEGERVGRWSIFHTYRKMGRIEEALSGFEALHADYGKGGDPSGYTEEELGECLHVLGRTDEAQPYFATAYEKLSADKWFADNEADRLARLKKLGAR